MKTCLVCQSSKPTTEFSYLKAGRGGLHPWCRDCVSAYNRSRYAAGKAPSRYVRKSAATIADYTPPRKDTTEIKDATPGFRCAERAWRKLKKRGSVPPWVRFEHVLPIYEMAAMAGPHFTVDHVVPIHGKTVCGLHVPWNLQLLTRSENSRKGAHF